VSGKGCDVVGGEKSLPRHNVNGWSGWLTGWLLARISRLRTGHRSAPRLALVERIALAPRQSLALIEAEGRRILVATSADGASAFYPLDEAARPSPHSATPFAPNSLPGHTSRLSMSRGPASRVSW
jgi:flagellar biogenesis protein FliO